MRSVIIAAVILCAVIFLTVCNSLYVGARIDELLSICEKLKSGSSAILTDELISRWENCRNIISLTNHHDDIERAENAITSLRHYLEYPADFGAQLEILTGVLEYIANAQRFSLEHIF